MEKGHVQSYLPLFGRSRLKYLVSSCVQVFHEFTLMYKSSLYVSLNLCVKQAECIFKKRKAFFYLHGMFLTI